VKNFLLRHFLKKNKRFKKIYNKEICYIFGNGSSIKYINLDDFLNHKSISINFMNLHKDFGNLNICGHVIPEPFFFFDYFKHPYTNKFHENILGKLFKNKIKEYPNIDIFTSISNMFFAPTKNTNYFHHFGERLPNKDICDLDYKFSFMAGGLHAAIGIAIYFGFSKAILVGCDYLYTPKRFGHFYSTKSTSSEVDKTNPYQDLLRNAQELIDLEILSIDGSSSEWLRSIDYNSISSKKPVYKENFELVDSYTLEELHRAYEAKLLFQKVKF
tara:strand:- start:777 stop:1592 length:816 start_codon:yes stop_codon:yes gene_type:complete